MENYRIWKVQQELNRCNNDWLGYLTECVRDSLKEIEHLKNEIENLKKVISNLNDVIYENDKRRIYKK